MLLEIRALLYTSEDLTAELEINRAMLERDGNQLVSAVAMFMARHRLKADQKIVEQIPFDRRADVAAGPGLLIDFNRDVTKRTAR